MSLHLPRRFGVPALGIALSAALLIAGVWAMTLERIGYERGEEVREVQAASAVIALALEEHVARTLLEGGEPALAERLAHFADKLGLGAATTLEVIALDGTVLARRSAQGASAGEQADAGLMAAARAERHGSLVSAQDAPRYVSYRVLADQPVLVSVTSSVAHALLAFRARERAYRRYAALATGTILAFALVLSVIWLRASQHHEQFRILEESVPEAFWVFDANARRAAYLSPAFRDIAGIAHRPAAAAWERWISLIHPEDRERALQAYERLGEGRLDVEHRIVRPDGAVRWIRVRGFAAREATGELYRVAGIIADESARRLAQQQLLHQKEYDSLTGLPNRLLCFDRIEQALARALHERQSVAVLLADLDRFQAVNESLGRAAGDALLLEVAHRLAGCARPGDTVARLGADQFALVLAGLARPLDARPVAQKALEAIAVPAWAGGVETVVTASVGIAAAPEDGADADTLLRNAEAAMRGAKRAGRNAQRFYAPAMNQSAAADLQLENELRRALPGGEFRLYFQPKHSLARGCASGLEALLRWQHPGRGLLAPAQFLPVLQDSGLLVAAGEWTLRAACRQLARWRASGVALVPVAVNVTVQQFLQTDVAALVVEALREAGLPAHLLEIEVTESDAMQRPEEVAATLARLKARGIRIAVDDFGTGYSSLSYLKRLPLDTLKLDRSFVDGLPADANDASISRAVIAMAHSLGLKVVAEGVETAAQRDFLAGLGCEEIQGYLIAAPLDADACAAYLGSAATPCAIAP